MSVIFPIFKPSHRWLSFWPLILFAGLIVLAGSLLWYYWPGIMLNSIQWQRFINRELSALIKHVAEHPVEAGGSLLAFSFVYGVLHAPELGHGKIVIATWLATHPSRLKTSLWLTFAASMLQGLVAIALVTVILTILVLPARRLHLSSFWLEKGNYILVAGLGLLLCWRVVKNVKKLLWPSPCFREELTAHYHHEQCGCGHQHSRIAYSLSTALTGAPALLLSLLWECVPVPGLLWCCYSLMLLVFLHGE